MSQNDIVTRMSGSLAEVVDMGSPDEVLASFFSVSGIADQLRELGWNNEEKIRTLVNIVRNSEKDSDKMKAIEKIDKMITEALEMSGAIVSGEQVLEEESDGKLTRQRSTKRAKRLVTNLTNPQTNPTQEGQQSVATLFPPKE